MDVDPRWSRFSTTDPDEGHDFLRAAYVDLKVRSTRNTAGFRLRASAGHVGDVPISRAHYSARTRLSTAPNTDLIVVHVHSGRYSMLGGRSGYTVPRGHTLLLPPDQALELEIEDFDLTAVCLPRELVEEVAEASVGIPAEGLRFESPRPISHRLERHWMNSVSYAGQVVLSGPHPQDDGPGALLATQTRRLLAAAFLATYPSTAMRADPGPAGQVEPSAVRRAVTHIEENAHRDVPLAEVARAAGLSIRALQESFRRHRDTTPSEFARRVRLERAHRELQAADPTGGDTVQTIARRWGFGHAGRFAGYYRSAFGQSPRRTLYS